MWHQLQLLLIAIRAHTQVRMYSRDMEKTKGGKEKELPRKQASMNYTL
jgi:hypothetical protein